jgi:hypothetical protein
MQSLGMLSMPVLNYVTLMLAFGKFVDRKDNVYPNPVTEEDINMNADKKLDVDPCNDRWITNFVDKGEKDQIRPSQAESIEKVDVVSVTFVPGVGGGAKHYQGCQFCKKQYGLLQNRPDRSENRSNRLSPRIWA